MAKLNLDDIQSNILRGYRVQNALDHVHYAFIKFEDQASARAWVAAAREYVTSTRRWDQLAAQNHSAPGTGSQDFIWNVGLSYEGMLRLGMPKVNNPPDVEDPTQCKVVDQPSPFSDQPAFVQGARYRGPKRLGDVGESAPERWEPAFQSPELHAVVSISAWSSAGIKAAQSALTATLRAAPNAKVLGEESGAGLTGEPKGTEHFGFVDGIGQPAIQGSGDAGYPGEGTPEGKRDWCPIPPGEFVLGHEDALGRRLHDTPLLANGSYMVFRKLQQRVADFRDYVARTAQENQQSPTYIAAKMVGRWPSGAPLVTSWPEDSEKIAKDPELNNNFRYADDPDGVRCPFGAHIRRANPRDDPQGPGALQSSLRRIVRRSTTYGGKLAEGSPEDGHDRGVLFTVINADIEQQFEFVQANWMNGTLSSNRLTCPEDRDALVGANQDRRGKLLMPSDQCPEFAWDLPRFVVVRGSGYFFLPSLTALAKIAQGEFAAGQGQGHPVNDRVCGQKA